MNNTAKYVYLDDEPADKVRAFAASVKSKNLDVVHEHPLPYLEQILELKKWQNEGKLDGLILDLRLDNFYKDDNSAIEKANYRAATLAQEIRTRTTENEIPDYPIVLWSTDERLRQSYDRDDTSHDLFDLKAVKGDLADPLYADHISRKLQSLVDGYNLVRGSIVSGSRPFSFLGFSETPEFLDERVLLSLESTKGYLPVHEYARFILRQLLEMSGPLVNRQVLAARLGLDINESEDFQSLTENLFPDSLYKGAFSYGWPCWWSALINQKLRKLSINDFSFDKASAIQRVEFLIQQTGFQKLKPAQPLLGSKSTSYRTVCVATSLPLDPREGFLIERQPIFPWQDKLYVSLQAILEGDANMKGIRVDLLEQDRLEKAKRKLSEK